MRKPHALTEKARERDEDKRPSFESLMPDAFAQLAEACQRLEARYRDAQTVEFTVEEGRLWILEARPAKRSTRAALRIAVDLAREGAITEGEAVARIDPASLDELLHPTLDPEAAKRVIAKGRPASPGAASGEIVFDPHEVEKLKAQGRSVILVRVETSPEDIHGMLAAKGIVTARGGVVSHAAVVARGMGLPCVTGAGALHIDYAGETMSAGPVTLKKGDVITINGSTGEIIEGAVPMREAELTGDLDTLIAWADQFRRMRVRGNAETPRDARQAREFGAEGIGLCRTEQMLFGPDRIIALREMILADDEQGRRAALAKLLPMQRNDLIELFEIMAGFPVTVRLFDAPLHEFLPQNEEEIAELAAALNVAAFKLKRRLGVLREANPMLGHRGCRLALTYPEIPEMQARAIFEAALVASGTTGRTVVPEIMIPLVASKAEIDLVKARIDAMADEVAAERGVKPTYQIGAMMELPRACLRAGAIAATAQFFSFGTNDLTQTTLGLSRDDAASFLGTYTAMGILGQDPFATIDEGVAELVEIAAERGRATRADIKLGICGEHGGDPATIAFCERIGLDYLSCSPFRVPVARLAAAQAALARAKSARK
jgi:pyruvate, orthophosphate dikinase